MEPGSEDKPIRTAVTFVVLALGSSVAYWGFFQLWRHGLLPFSMEKGDLAPKSVPGVVVWLLFQTFGPALAAVLALAICEGSAAVRELGRRLIQWRMRSRLYVLAWFGIVINSVVVAVGLATHTLHFDGSALAPVKFVVFFFLMAILDGPLGEEVGWRGVLLPRLLRRLPPVSAALVVGFVWYLWHVPLYAISGRMPTAVEHLFFLYTCLALSCVMTWFFLASDRSVLLMVYLHNASNYSTFLRAKLFPKSADSPLLYAAYGVPLLVIAAAAVVALYSNARHERKA